MGVGGGAGGAGSEGAGPVDGVHGSIERGRGVGRRGERLRPKTSDIGGRGGSTLGGGTREVVEVSVADLIGGKVRGGAGGGAWPLEGGVCLSRLWGVWCN